MNRSRVLRPAAVILCVAGLAWLSGCDPCDGARVRVAGEHGQTKLDVCAEVASTEAERRQGLAGRSGIDDEAGLLLDFPVTGEVCITGEGMQFALDVVFIDEGARVAAVTGLAAGGAPTCEPGVRRVLEVRAGAAGSVAPLDLVTIRSPRDAGD